MRIPLEYIRDHLSIAPLAFHTPSSRLAAPAWLQIIQYESGSIKDMPTIASVFFNRLNDPNWGYLESSVTRCYVIGQERDDDWRKCEVTLDYNDPYDTYANPGLPPGPISCPPKSCMHWINEASADGMSPSHRSA